MKESKDTYVALFDFDGVVVDTEPQYSQFWSQKGREYLGMDDLADRIKGQTLTEIYNSFFPGMKKEQEQILSDLYQFEQQMYFDYIPGVLDFITDLRANGVRMAIVTSSNNAKMEAVYQSRPEIKSLFDHILTAEMFPASKPAPDCYLLGMRMFGSTPNTTWVFEDSFNGLRSGMDSGATVIGLATTNSRERIAPLCHYILDDFTGFTCKQMLQITK